MFKKSSRDDLFHPAIMNAKLLWLLTWQVLLLSFQCFLCPSWSWVRPGLENRNWGRRFQQALNESPMTQEPMKGKVSSLSMYALRTILLHTFH